MMFTSQIRAIVYEVKLGGVCESYCSVADISQGGLQGEDEHDQGVHMYIHQVQDQHVTIQLPWSQQV